MVYALVDADSTQHIEILPERLLVVKETAVALVGIVLAPVVVPQVVV
jgi:hypothetical protein